MAELKSLKRSKDDIKKDEEVLTVAGDEAVYPYGSRIHLNQNEIDKLDVGECKVGDEVMITAKAKVVEKSEYETEKNKRMHIEFQLTSMAVTKGSDVTKEQEGLYDN